MDTQLQTPATPGEDSVTLGDKRVEINAYERYKGEANRTDRLAFISSTLARAHTHYFESGTVKKKFRCISTPGHPAICCQKMGDPRQEFGLILFHYTTDPENPGEVLMPTALKGSVKIWILSEAKFQELSAQHKQWPLLDDPAGFATKQHDLIVKCTEARYQKMTLTISPVAHWKTKQEWYNALKIKEQSAKAKMKMAMGWSMTESEISAMFGISVTGPNPTGQTSNAGDVDLSDILA